MAIKHIRKRQKNSNGTFDTIHYETSASVVWTEDGVSVEDALKNAGGEPVEVTLSTSSWTEQADGSHAQNVSVAGVTANNTNLVDCHQTDSDKDANIEILKGWGCVNDCKQSAGTLKFICYGDPPTVNVPVSVVVM